ncbi:hypothetical protein CVT24_010907 [Panaeolus cyanescens]|uniref:Uncharacterized protein n=1 Tax=Panaeolus cyanescens TaxID=181874 RepID=A0A409XB63_9AGAR|nr:hypothetical protein CVT24_010907 [Panaeolus cyanescens]
MYSAGSHKQTEIRADIATHNDSEFLGCTADQFERCYLPFKPSEDEVDTCVKALERANLFDGRRFTDLRRRGGNNETETFLPLVEITASLRNQRLPGRRLNDFSFESCPNTALKSDMAGGNRRIDACLRESSNTASNEKEIHVSDIAVPMEFKVKCTDTEKYQVCARFPFNAEDVFGLNIPKESPTAAIRCP